MRFLGFWRLRSARGAPGLRQSCASRGQTRLLHIGIGHEYEDVFPKNSENEVKEALKSRQCVYAGFDPTADSLHTGNLKVLLNLLRWQRAGHQVVVVLGGATAMIGDPTGRLSKRDDIKKDTLERNINGIRRDIETVFDNHAKYYNKEDKELLPPIIVNNMEWYQGKSVIPFARDIGKHCRLGTMLLRSSVQTRLKTGEMTLKEFMYQMFQAYDWHQLVRRYDCRFQVGGGDQMGNIVAGHDLISRMDDKKVYGLTLPLLLDENSEKVGKSTGASCWLSPEKTSSVRLYEHFAKAGQDACVEEMLKGYTLYDDQEITEIMERHGLHAAYGPHRVGDFITRLIHGEQGVKDVEKLGPL